MPNYYLDAMRDLESQFRSMQEENKKQQAWDMAIRHFGRPVYGSGPGGLATFTGVNKSIKALPGAYGDPYAMGKKAADNFAKLPDQRAEARQTLNNMVFEAQQRRLRDWEEKRWGTKDPLNTNPYDLSAAMDAERSSIYGAPGVKAVIESLGGLGDGGYRIPGYTNGPRGL